MFNVTACALYVIGGASRRSPEVGFANLDFEGGVFFKGGSFLDIPPDSVIFLSKKREVFAKIAK